MVDIADRASKRESEILADALAVNRAVSLVGPCRKNCIECTEPISEGRLEAVPGCQLCAECQAEHEELKRRGLTK